MKGGNGVSVSERNYAFAGTANITTGVQYFWFAFGELRNSAPVGRFITAFQSFLSNEIGILTIFTDIARGGGRKRQ
ncbi:MAG: hypothetical protein IJQ39_05440 [Thermoguttaceae bacterium]|nr:hypothetical protein [Thermoguttaceae bacterium]